MGKTIHTISIKHNIIKYDQCCLYFLDDWITRVYKPNRSIKEKTIRLSHLVQKTRYKAHPVKEVLLRKRLKHDREVLNT